jgi:hypothetical protein
MDPPNPEEVKQLLSEVSSEIANGNYDKKSVDAIKTALECIKNYKSIDQALVQTLKDMLGTDSLHDKDSYDNVVKSLEEGSVLVYFKSAQLFKAYKKDDVEKLLSGQLRTIYKHLATSYEIIPNNSKQKIIILAELSLEKHLNRIKQYIVAFMQEHGDVNLSSDDILCFKNQEAETVEIVINNYYVENSNERDEIVKALLDYIREKEQNNQMTRRMGFQNASVFKDANMVSMPSEKQQVTNTEFTECTDMLVSNIGKCVPIARDGTNINIMIGTVSTLNINNGAVSNTTNIHTNETSDDVDSTLIDEFVEYIIANKPEWFKEGEWIDKSILLQKFIEMYKHTPKVFYTLLQNRLYIKEKRARITNRKGGRALQVKLITFSEK